MAVVGVFSGSYCHGKDVAQRLAERLGYTSIENRLLDLASSRFGVAKATLSRAMTEEPSLFARRERDRLLSAARLKAALAPLICEDRGILCGPASLLLPNSVAHVLKVCVIARHDYRLEVARERDKLSEREARKQIKKSDNQNLHWSKFLHNRTPYDDSLYDIVIPIDRTPVEEAVEVICGHAGSEPLRTTPISLRAAEDFVFAAEVNLKLVEAGHQVGVRAAAGRVTLIINKYVVRLDHYADELKRVVEGMPGVTAIEWETGPDFRPPSVNPWTDIDVPLKILLVDDEKEYVHTLSDRLRTRDIGTTIAYDGEEALASIQKEQPDVMILDLQMPGINGIEVLRRVKRERPEVQVIILTGHGSEREEVLAEELGAFAYLTKPVSINDLTQTMREAYEKGKLARTGAKAGDQSTEDEAEAK